MRFLPNINGLTLPKSISGDVLLSSFLEINNVVFPTNVGGTLYLDELIWAKNSTFPVNVGCLYVAKLESAKNVTFPVNIKNAIFLNNLLSLDGINIPHNFKYNSVISDYISIEDLVNKSLEQSQVEEIHKQKGFSNIYILALFTYISSLILTLIGFLILK